MPLSEADTRAKLIDPTLLTVITMEGGKKTGDVNKSSGRFVGEIKIPNMCNHFGIKFLSTFELLRALKIGL